VDRGCPAHMKSGEMEIHALCHRVIAGKIFQTPVAGCPSVSSRGAISNVQVTGLTLPYWLQTVDRGRPAHRESGEIEI
jgi:hypothetical protein